MNIEQISATWALLVLSLLATGASAASPLSFPCRSAPLSAAVRASEAMSISRVIHRAMLPRRIDYLLESGAWKMVWTTPPQDGRDVYLFKRTAARWAIVDRWHGDLGTDDPQAGLDWAKARHVPTDLTSCFGTVLVNRP